MITDDGTVVFRADRKDGVQGIYAAAPRSVQPVTETGEAFETLGHFPSANEGGTVAFAATLPSDDGGIFVVDDGRIATILETDDRGFESCRGALITNGGAVVSIATPVGGGLGLFFGPDPVADRILACGDPLLASTVENLAANPVSVNSAGELAVRVRLEDGRQLILRSDSLGSTPPTLGGV